MLKLEVLLFFLSCLRTRRRYLLKLKYGRLTTSGLLLVLITMLNSLEAGAGKQLPRKNKPVELEASKVHRSLIGL